MGPNKKMRAPSPALSENELDIGNSLFGTLADERVKAHDVDKRDLNLFDGVGLGSASEADDDAAAIARHESMLNRKASSLKGRTVKKGGGFQAMGLNPNLLKAITRKGFSVPTPIQRKTIPLLIGQKDVVGMARTGSGKTAAFIIPMIEKLKAHSTQIGSRALVLSPSRELALQTLQVTRELARGTDLKSILLVGGDSLEDQFAAMSTNPDIIIAAPGRFVHLMVEMNLDLSSVQYVVFDEADRLFEMGFAEQLSEILHALPPSRQTLLFSATLPKTLVEFARAGLQDPILVRLDAESKISPDLQSSFFSVKSSEKDGALLHILQDIIQVPTASQIDTASSEGQLQNRKRKRDSTQEETVKPSPTSHSTIIFAATKHRVEYLHTLLTLRGYSASHVYGTLDQTARKQQVSSFRSGATNILVVTDVAARGIDIPVLANVINYDFPAQPKIFVHRVGRTARAGQRGWSYSLVNDADAPYLLDLQLFLGRKLSVGRARKDDVNMAEEVVVGTLSREDLQSCSEWVTRMLETEVDLFSLSGVAANGDKRYLQTRGAASAESAKRSKTLVGSAAWGETHPLFAEDNYDLEAQREKMLARIGGFRPEESIFEIGARRGGKKHNEEAVDAIRKIRSGLKMKKQKTLAKNQSAAEEEPETKDSQHIDNDDPTVSQSENEAEDETTIHLDSASDADLEITFSNHKPSQKSQPASSKNKGPTTYRDPENYLSYTPLSHNAAEETAYSINPSSNFTTAADSATLDLNPDESSRTFGSTRQVMRWDKRHKKYVRRANDEDGSKGARLVRGESGAKIAASFRSGRFDAWRKANRVGRMARIGESEKASGGDGGADVKLGGGGRKGRHRKVAEGKKPDKFRDDFEKKKKRLRERNEAGGVVNGASSGKGSGKIVNSVDDIRKERKLKEKRREKNARPSHKAAKR